MPPRLVGQSTDQNMAGGVVPGIIPPPSSGFALQVQSYRQKSGEHRMSETSCGSLDWPDERFYAALGMSRSGMCWQWRQSATRMWRSRSRSAVSRNSGVKSTGKLARTFCRWRISAGRSRAATRQINSSTWLGSSIAFLLALLLDAAGDVEVCFSAPGFMRFSYKEVDQRAFVDDIGPNNRHLHFRRDLH